MVRKVMSVIALMVIGSAVALLLGYCLVAQ
jgi:hypothetical protein